MRGQGGKGGGGGAGGGGGGLGEKAGGEEAHGRPWKVEGGLLLLVFLGGGSGDGFAAGYYRRMLFTEGAKKEVA